MISKIANRIKIFFSIVKEYFKLIIRNINYKITIKRLSKKKKINVIFMILYDSIWKCDELYKMMINHKRYNPIILICPVINFGRENMLMQMEKSYKTFFQLGYHPIKSYTKSNNTYIDLYKDLSADIVFYTNPYDGLIDDRYNIRKLKSALPCYIPYFYNTSTLKMFYDLPFHRLLWKYFIETEHHLHFAKKNDKIWSFSNCEVVGYSVFDDFEKYAKNGLIIKSNKKRVIWAPHHTISEDDIFKQSSFFMLHNMILDLCFKYKDSVEFIFRPHPLLKLKLYNHKEWGKEKTDMYYNKWRYIENGKLSDGGDYIPEFYNSDAIIHDCGSFLCEYLYMEKPAIYVSMDEDNYLASLNTIAKEAYHSHYIVYNKEQLEKTFIEVIINNNDKLTTKRKMFKKQYLKISNDKVSNKIIQILDQTLRYHE